MRSWRPSAVLTISRGTESRTALLSSLTLPDGYLGRLWSGWLLACSTGSSWRRRTRRRKRSDSSKASACQLVRCRHLQILGSEPGLLGNPRHHPGPPLFDRMPTYRTQGKRSLNFLSATPKRCVVCLKNWWRYSAKKAPYRGLFPSPPLFDRMPTYRTQGKRSLNFLSAWATPRPPRRGWRGARLRDRGFSCPVSWA